MRLQGGFTPGVRNVPLCSTHSAFPLIHTHLVSVSVVNAIAHVTSDIFAIRVLYLERVMTVIKLLNIPFYDKMHCCRVLRKNEDSV